jgi:hypothetical protein
MRRNVFSISLLLAVAVMAMPKLSNATTVAPPTPVATIVGIMTQSVPVITTLTAVAVPNIQMVNVQCVKNANGLYSGSFNYTETSGLNLNTTNVGLLSKTTTSVTLYAHVAYTNPSGVFCLYDVALLTVTKSSSAATVTLKIMDPLGKVTYLTRTGVLPQGSTVVF